MHQLRCSFWAMALNNCQNIFAEVLWHYSEVDLLDKMSSIYHFILLDTCVKCHHNKHMNSWATVTTKTNQFTCLSKLTFVPNLKKFLNSYHVHKNQSDGLTDLKTCCAQRQTCTEFSLFRTSHCLREKVLFLSIYVLSPLTWFIHMKQTDLCSKGLFCMQLVTFPWQPMLVASKLEWSPVGGSNGVADKVNAPYGTSSLVNYREVFSTILDPEWAERPGGCMY